MHAYGGLVCLLCPWLVLSVLSLHSFFLVVFMVLLVFFLFCVFSLFLSLSISFFLSLYVYIYAVELITGPRFGIFKVNNWATFVFYKKLFFKKHYKNRGFSRFF